MVFTTINYTCTDKGFTWVDKCAFQDIYCELDVVTGTYAAFRVLDLRRNVITYLNHIIFEYIINMTHLYLSDNNLVYIEEYTFSKNTKLEVFHISNNRLAKLPTNIFQNTTQLTTIYLDNNNFTTFIIDSENLLVVQFISLENNPLISLDQGTWIPFLRQHYYDNLNITIDVFKNSSLCEQQWILNRKMFVKNIIENVWIYMENKCNVMKISNNS